jgi:hypothetical protein
MLSKGNGIGKEKRSRTSLSHTLGISYAMKATIQGGFFALRSKANKKVVFTLLFSNILI